MQWFTADLHLGHINIINYCNRPFGSVAEMDETLLARWNKLISTDDTVFVLGDVALGSFTAGLAKLKQCYGRKILVSGNHDRCWSGHKKMHPGNAYDLYRDVFDDIYDYARLTGVGSPLPPLHMSHFPYAGDHTEADRYTDYRPTDDGSILLHGHVHDAWKVRGRQINIGVDVWDYAPVSEATLAVLIATRHV